LENTSIPEGRALQEALDGCNMWSRAHLLTNISKEKNDDLAAIFSLATVYMQPSIYEGFGLSLLDAMQCETLVVAANSSSLPEVGGKAVLYCDPYDVKDMTRVMLRAIEMKADEKRKMQELMRIQLQNFSWEKTANETAAVYRKVCAQ
jgi:glycosyltransferase involved in cell wall biosynthesis